MAKIVLALSGHVVVLERYLYDSTLRPLTGSDVDWHATSILHDCNVTEINTTIRVIFLSRCSREEWT